MNPQSGPTQDTSAASHASQQYVSPSGADAAHSGSGSAQNPAASIAPMLAGNVSPMPMPSPSFQDQATSYHAADQATSRPTNGVASTTNSGVPNTAEDTDLIEKEWVQRAKDIVNKTYNDPHKQSQELNSFKAEYIKMRYDKDIKLSE